MLNAFQHGQLLVMWYVELPAVATKKNCNALKLREELSIKL